MFFIVYVVIRLLCAYSDGFFNLLLFSHAAIVILIGLVFCTDLYGAFICYSVFLHLKLYLHLYMDVCTPLLGYPI